METSSTLSRDIGLICHEFDQTFAQWNRQLQQMRAVAQAVEEADIDLSRLTHPDQCIPLRGTVLQLAQAWASATSGMPFFFLPSGGQENISDRLRTLETKLREELPLKLQQRQEAAERARLQQEAEARAQAEKDAALTRELERLGFARKAV